MERFDKILFFVDSQAPEAKEIEKAVERAMVLGASLTLAGVVPGRHKSRFLSLGGPPPEELERLSIEDETSRLKNLVSAYGDRGVELSLRVLGGKPTTVIPEAVLEDGFDMVWKTPIKSSMPGDRLLGSLDMRLIRACPCPICIVDDRERKESQTVFVAAIDVTPMPEDEDSNEKLNRHILELALSGLTGEGHKLHVIHAWKLYGESILKSPRSNMTSKELDDLREKERDARCKKIENLLADFKSGLSASEAARFDPEIHLIKGDPKTAIPAKIQALEADILVIGTVSRSGLSGLILGNTAEAILHNLACSVVVVKPDGFVSAVEAG